MLPGTLLQLLLFPGHLSCTKHSLQNPVRMTSWLCLRRRESAVQSAPLSTTFCVWSLASFAGFGHSSNSLMEVSGCFHLSSADSHRVRADCWLTPTLDCGHRWYRHRYHSRATATACTLHQLTGCALHGSGAGDPAGTSQVKWRGRYFIRSLCRNVRQ